jgi:hypothetical protein
MEMSLWLYGDFSVVTNHILYSVFLFLFLQQGRQATRVFLEQFVRMSPPPIKEAPDRRSYCRDDLPHFIDDEVSEIIDERDYMEGLVTKNR